MPDRRLVVFEADPGAPEYGQMRAIAPNKAGGIPIPTFGMGPTTPAVGNSVGEAFYNSTNKTGFVWDGSAWRSIVKDPMLSFATDADLLANTTAGVGTYAISRGTGNVYIKKTAGWSLLGIEEFSTVANLLSTTPTRGTIAVALDEGSTWEMTTRGWRCFNIRHFPNTAGVLAWAGAGSGAQPGDFAVAEDVDVLYARTAGGWKPRSVWSDTEANIRASTWAVDGQEALSSDTGRAFSRVGGAWVEEPIAHFPTEAALLASTLKDGSLAWSDDTSVIFIRAAGAWKRVAGQQMAVGATAPTGTHAVGDEWFNTTNKELMIWDGTKYATSTAIGRKFKEGTVTLGATATAGAIVKLIKNIPYDNEGLYISIVDTTGGGGGANFQLFAIPFDGDSGKSTLKELGSCAFDDKVESFSFHWDSGDNYHLNVKFKAAAAGRVYKIGLMSLTGDVSGVVFDGTTVGTADGPTVHPGGFESRLAVGSIQQSLLTETQFNAEMGGNGKFWVLADGRDVTGSRWAALTGQNKIPDLRGAFIRAAGVNKDNATWDGGTVGTFRQQSTARPNTPFTTDSQGAHTHNANPQGYYMHFDTVNGGWAAGSDRVHHGQDAFQMGLTTSSAGAHTHSITGGGDAETAPKHVSLNTFIKIN